jgi:acyl-CoA synthetase (AMP-forming)/AMP-acid ligase II
MKSRAVETRLVARGSRKRLEKSRMTGGLHADSDGGRATLVCRAQTERCHRGQPRHLADQLSRYKHPESYEIVDASPRDDSGKVRRTLLRDERAAWLQQGRDFRIMPSSVRKAAE